MCETRKSRLCGKITVLLVICLFALSARAKYGGGTGETNDPYLIYTAEQINEIGMSVNSEDLDKCFKLMADIDLEIFTGTSFNTIGYYVDFHDNKPFRGVFDGNGYTVSNFSYTSIDKSFTGLFEYVMGGQIKNLGLVGPNIYAGTGNYVGSLVGYFEEGTVTGCYVKGGRVLGTLAVGALAGSNGGEITNCYAIGSVEGEFRVGGLVGEIYSNGTITNCYSTGSD